MSYGTEAVVRFAAEARSVSLLHSVQTGSGIHQAPYPMDTIGSFDGVRRPGRESKHPSSVEVNNVGIITPLHRMSSWHRANCTL
jgi:hypothetical protein